MIHHVDRPDDVLDDALGVQRQRLGLVADLAARLARLDVAPAGSVPSIGDIEQGVDRTIGRDPPRAQQTDQGCLSQNVESGRSARASRR